MIDSKTERERNEVSPHVDKFQGFATNTPSWISLVSAGMGTNVQANVFIDLTGSTSNDMRTVSYHNGYSGHDIEKVRRTIIEHESIFRHQLQDLHRLYGRQRELMSEIKKYVSKDKCLPIVPPPQDPRSLRAFEPRFFTSGTLLKGADRKDGFLSDNNQVMRDGDTKLSLSVVQTSHQRTSDAFYPKSTNFLRDLSVSNPKDGISDDFTLPRGGFNLVMKDFFQNSLDGKSCPSILGLRNERSGKVTIKEPLHCPYTGTSVSLKKRKIFGVEISGDEYPFGTTSNFSTSLYVSSSCMKNLELARRNVNDAKNELNFGNRPFHLTGSDPGKCFKNSNDVNSKAIEFQSNHKPPQNELPWFLKNSQVSSDSSKQKKSSYFMNLDSLQNYSENFFRKAETAEGKFHTLEQKKEIMMETNQVEDLVIPNLSRPRIDLNLCLDDEDAPSLPTAAEIIEPDVSLEECDKIAADAIIDISSSSTKKSLSDEGSCDLLKWLADIISSPLYDEVKPLPDCMDEFEFTTLRLEDVKEEHHCHEHVMLKSPTSDTLASKRSRRGRQQKRDFQRDILPGLVTLSRLEVTEDFQTFQELMKAKWGPARNGRGRKRLGQVEMSLTGWGRRTKRLPRKRCGNAVKW